MATLDKIYLSSDAIDGQVVSNNVFIKGKDVAGTGTINVVKVTTSDELEFGKTPFTPSEAPNSNYKVANKKYVDDTVANYLPTSQKGAASGLCPLNSSSKIDSTYLSDSILGQLEYKGVFDCSGGTYPSSPSTGWYYIASVGGTISGTVYTVGDWLVYNGASWDKVDNTDAVASVNTKTGAVVLNTDDISESGTPTNKWFTDTRAKTAVVLNTLAGSETDQAPSVSSVNTALSGKSSTSHNHTGVYSAVGHGHVAADISDFASVAKSSAIVNSTAGTETDQAASVSAMKSYVGSAVGAGMNPHREEVTLTADHITNGYFDCAYELLLNTILVMPSNPCGPVQTYDVDWTHSVVSTKSRITLKVGGTLKAVCLAGHKIVIQGFKGTNA